MSIGQLHLGHPDDDPTNAMACEQTQFWHQSFVGRGFIGMDPVCIESVSAETDAKSSPKEVSLLEIKPLVDGVKNCQSALLTGKRTKMP